MSLLGKKYENVHTHNALSRKIAPVLNSAKIFVDLSCFFYFDQGRVAVQGPLVIYIIVTQTQVRISKIVKKKHPNVLVCL